jgi:hypothetical protein
MLACLARAAAMELEPAKAKGFLGSSNPIDNWGGKQF